MFVFSPSFLLLLLFFSPDFPTLSSSPQTHPLFAPENMLTSSWSGVGDASCVHQRTACATFYRDSSWQDGITGIVTVGGVLRANSSKVNEHYWEVYHTPDDTQYFIVMFFLSLTFFWDSLLALHQQQNRSVCCFLCLRCPGEKGRERERETCDVTRLYWLWWLQCDCKDAFQKMCRCFA